MIAFGYAGEEPSLGSDGSARIIVPNDLRGGRYISNLVNLQILDATAIASAVPEPSTWAMMLIGLCGLGLAAGRRERRAGVAKQAQDKPLLQKAA